jgi:hypothetical protein
MGRWAVAAPLPIGSYLLPLCPSAPLPIRADPGAVEPYNPAFEKAAPFRLNGAGVAQVLLVYRLGKSGVRRFEDVRVHNQLRRGRGEVLER